ncbi:hypothetical protein B0T17DRAFT_490185 [Bombardia bombarda]|uniref:RRM domain-containing protein n=1 Tax=Bombardia bombarda TaxID=252184 RepID=A0AA39XAA5_9PEZI|nr:hypothetical protein B0T17DRAFT_490185 [Bombardia bombarda]
MDSPRQAQAPQTDALAEGRRIYVGNLLYSVKPVDIETLLQETGFGQYEKIHISVDPISGRNPGYCFVEFTSVEEAERALTSLAGVTVFDRPVKVGPCHPKAASQRREPAGARWGSSTSSPSPSTAPAPTFQRWGDWSADKRKPAARDEQGPYGALKHLGEMKESDPDGRRVYVGGLGKMIDQSTNEEEIRELFAGYDIIAIGKRITPHPSTRDKPGNHHYCFLDFGSREEAERAVSALNGQVTPMGSLRVYIARGAAPPRRADEGTGSGDIIRRTQSPRERVARLEQPRPDRDDKEERNNRQRVIMESRSWRTSAPANAQ